ncbi:MAG: Gfo/Idh/MocA family oxidoreductase [Thermomicrobiales bacterium]
MRTLGVGVVGVGVLGKMHAENLARRIHGARVTAIADVRTEAAQQIADELGVARVYASAEELAADPDVEALVIVSNDGAHAAGILAAAANGKDVFCEKPITTTLEDADRVLAAVAQSGVTLQIGFMRRYDAAYAAAKAAIDAGRIGTPILIKAAHRGKYPFPRQPGAGPDPSVFFNSCIHDSDNARWLLGDEAVEVTAIANRVVASTSADGQGTDVAVTTIRFAKGALGDIENVSSAFYGYDVRTEVVGDRGALFIGSLRETGCVLATEAGLSSDITDHWLTRFGQTYLIELEDWVRRTLAGEPPFCTGADGRAALEIAMAATTSHRERRPVALPL